MNIIKLDRQLETQPKEVVFCRSCVVSNQRFRLQVGQDGICSACNFRKREQTEINWAEREKELQELAAELRRRPGIHGVVAVSGGKDSGWIAHTLKNELGLNIVCACFRPFVRTDIGERNYQAFINSGFQVLEGCPNGNFHRKLARLCFDTLLDHWGAFGLAQMAYPHWLALQLKAPTVWYCENGSAHYDGDPAVINLKGMPVSEWATRYHKGRTIDDLVDFGLENGYFHKSDFTAQDLAWYRAPDPQELEDAGLNMHWLAAYRRHDPMEAFYTASQYTGFQPNTERSEGTYTKYSSIDDKCDGFHFWLGWIKMGIGRATSDASHEVRDGQLTRDEAVALVRRYDGEFPKRYFQEFLEYLDITEEHFWEVVNAWRAPHLWAKDAGGKWKLRHQVS